ncbi:MAG TPA: FAD-dependent oxidoreductase [Kineosporiaceae bacterium]|nr:FAD-dependent oxidoreductase [Kineosporiaceae bacterium]
MTGRGGAPVVVVGAGIAGTACARALQAAGLPVRVLDRGRRLGGRMALRREQLGYAERVVDIGASYFTVSDPAFAAVVEDWQARGLARAWTDSFTVLHGDGRPPGVAGGPVRWAAPGGLRCLVEDLAAGLDVTSEHEVEQVDVDGDALAVDGEPAAAVVLAMPQPQAVDLLPEPLADRLGLDTGLEWNPVLTVWSGWRDRWWAEEMDGAFVDGSPVVAWVADDGRRRGDGAPVLVVHSTTEYAERWLDDPEGGVAGVLEALHDLLGAGEPQEPLSAKARRWSLASPVTPQERPFALDDETLVGVCGDAWGAKPRVEQAWLSGHALGRELAGRLTS